jgi:hypothetical protein
MTLNKCLILTAALLAGCSLTPSRWDFPPGGSQEQFNRDQYQCTLDARASNQGYVDFGVFNQCMQVRGYRPGK